MLNAGVAPVIHGGNASNCGGYYEKWTQLKDGSWGCRPLMWEEMDEYLTWRWWTYRVYLPVGIPLGIIGAILLFCIFGYAVIKWSDYMDAKRRLK